MVTRPSWTEYGLELAETAAKRSACSRSQVGAVILDEHKRIIGVGYNGLPSGFLECSEGGCPRGASNSVAPGSDYTTIGPGYCPAAHAEVNAVLNASKNVRGCEMFVTRQPCNQCMAFLAQAGISRVIFGQVCLDPAYEIAYNVDKSMEGFYE